jgi:hypothetical protein
MFCSDFDDPVGHVFDGWTRTLRVGTGDVSVDTGSFLSAPRSYTSRVTPSEVDSNIGRLERELPRTAARTRLSFALKMNPPTTKDAVMSVAELLCINATEANGVWLRWYVDGAGLAKLGVETHTPDSVAFVPIDPTNWRRVELDVVWGQTSTVTVRVDGTDIAVAKQGANCASAAYDAFSFNVGVAAGRLDAPVAASFDDVLVELEQQQP